MRRLHLARSCASCPDNSLRQIVTDVVQPPPIWSSSPCLPRHLHHHHSLAHILFSVVNTCPYHFNLLSCTSVDISSTFVVAPIHNSVQLGDSTHPLPLTMNNFNISEVFETLGSTSKSNQHCHAQQTICRWISKAGHRSTLALLRFCVIAATGIRKHTQVETLWITRRIRRISAFPSNSERLDASVFTSTLPATKRNSRTISTRATDVIFERKHCSRRRSHTQVTCCVSK